MENAFIWPDLMVDPNVSVESLLSKDCPFKTLNVSQPMVATRRRPLLIIGKHALFYSQNQFKINSNCCNKLCARSTYKTKPKV